MSVTRAARAAEPFSPSLRKAVVVVMIGAALPFVDSTIVNVAVHDLSADLQAPLTRVQWVVTAYLLALAAVIPVTAWAARRFGAARVYIAALATFTLGSACCAVSTGMGMLICARVLQGAGGGVILPVGTMIWAAQASKAQMARVVALIGIPVVAAPLLGPTLGGLLIAASGWRAIFAINVPIGLAGLIIAARFLPRARGEAVGRLDWAGLLLAATGTTGITYGLARLAQHTNDWAWVAALIAGIACLAGFVWHALRASSPLLDLRLYTSRAFTAASVTSFGIGAAMFGGMILMPLYFQIVRGQAVIATGLLLTPAGIGALVANRASTPLTDRFGSGVTALAGGIIATIGTVPFLFLSTTTSYVWIGVFQAFRGIGIGLTLVPVMTAAYRALPSATIPDATPQLNVLQRVGGALGTAVFTVVLTQAGLRPGSSPSDAASAFGTAFAWVLALTVVATVPTAWIARTERAATRHEALPGRPPRPKETSSWS